MRLRKQFLIILSMACLLLLSSCSVMDQVQNIFVSNSEALEYNDKGFKLMEEERHEEALDYFFKGVTSLEEGGGNKKTMGTLYNNISWAYTSLGEYEESLEYIDKAIEITPNDAIVVSNRANALYGLGRYDEALESFNKALEIDKHLDVAHYGKGVYHYDHDEYELALEAFTTYLSYEKNDEDAITYKVYSFLYLDKIDEALSFIEEHIAKDKENYFAYDLKANVLDWESKYDELKALYQELMALFPDTLDPKIHVGRVDYIQGHYEEDLAFTYLELKDIANAKVNYQKSLELYPENDKALYVKSEIEK